MSNTQKVCEYTLFQTSHDIHISVHTKKWLLTEDTTHLSYHTFVTLKRCLPSSRLYLPSSPVSRIPWAPTVTSPHFILTSQFIPYPSQVHRNETSKRQTLLFPAVKLPGKRLQLVHREQGQASTSSIPSEPTNASCTSCTRHTGKQFVSFAHNIYCMSLNVKIT